MHRCRSRCCCLFSPEWVIGNVNGLLVTKFRIPSLIATLAMGPIVLGLNYAYDKGDAIYASIPDAFNFIATGMVLGFVPFPVLFATIVAALIYVFMNKTSKGRAIVATGANIQAAAP